MRSFLIFTAHQILFKRRKRLVRHVSCRGEGRGAYRISVRKPEGKETALKCRHRWEVTLKWIFNKQYGRVWTVLSGSGQRQVVGCYDYGDEPAGSIKCKGFSDQVRNCQLFKKHHTSVSQLVTDVSSTLTYILQSTRAQSSASTVPALILQLNMWHCVSCGFCTVLNTLRTGLLNCLNARSRGLTFRHRASCIQGQAFHYSPENTFYIFNQQIYFII